MLSSTPLLLSTALATTLATTLATVLTGQSIVGPAPVSEPPSDPTAPVLQRPSSVASTSDAAPLEAPASEAPTSEAPQPGAATAETPAPSTATPDLPSSGLPPPEPSFEAPMTPAPPTVVPSANPPDYAFGYPGDWSAPPPYLEAPPRRGKGLMGSGVVVLGGAGLLAATLWIVAPFSPRPTPYVASGIGIAAAGVAAGVPMVVLGSRRMTEFSVWHRRENQPATPHHGVTFMAAGGAITALGITVLAIAGSDPDNFDVELGLIGSGGVAAGTASLITGIVLHRRYRAWEQGYVRPQSRLSLPGFRILRGGAGLSWSGRF